MHSAYHFCNRPDYSDVQKQFADALRSAGLELGVKDPIGDGRWHRCRVDGKAKAGSYKFHIDDSPPRGLIHNWRDSLGCRSWHYQYPEGYFAELSRQNQIERRKEQIEQRVRYLKARREAKEELERDRKQAAKQARRWWKLAGDNGNDVRRHPYLRTKGVQPHGVRQYGRDLIVPLVAADDGPIENLQRISPGGKKLYLKGGRAGGCFYKIPGTGKVVICEGFATGASIQEATGYTVYCVMTSGNLLTVAKTARNQHPKANIIIAADDDWKTEGNPGFVAAMVAAEAINVRLTLPIFPKPRADTETDFNDLMKRSGTKRVRHLIQTATFVKHTKEK
jgi:putative DNA primase/helicase